MESFFLLIVFFLALSLSVTALTDIESPSPSPSPFPSQHVHHHEQISAPPPTLGGTVPSAPAAFPWPFRPHQSQSPSPSPNTAATPYLLPEKGGASIPFINSNPAVPLPTGEVDSATIRPFPTSSSSTAPHSHGSGTTKIIVGLIYAVQVALYGVILGF